jgi:RHS repeat-associated protein
MQMQPASSPAMPETPLAVLRPGGEKPHQGFLSRNPALYQGPTVCNSTTALGLRGQAKLNRVGSRCTGKERDAESGNDYFLARYYSSAMGRFMSPDWSAQEQPVPYANLDDPQSLNLYAYVRNNPLSRTDADGHCGDGWHWLCNFGQALKNGFTSPYGFHTDATVKSKMEAERSWILQGATDQGAIKTVNGWDPSKVHDVYKCMHSDACMQALANVVATATQFGWPGQQSYNSAKNQLNKVNTPEGTVDNQTLGGKVPTQEEAVKLIEESGGKVERIEEGHGPDSVSHHDYPHINYTTADGAKGTIQIQSVQQ